MTSTVADGLSTFHKPAERLPTPSSPTRKSVLLESHFLRPSPAIQRNYVAKRECQSRTIKENEPVGNALGSLPETTQLDDCRTRLLKCVFLCSTVSLLHKIENCGHIHPQAPIRTTCRQIILSLLTIQCSRTAIGNKGNEEELNE
jgi:hypothetical protein